MARISRFSFKSHGEHATISDRFAKFLDLASYFTVHGPGKNSLSQDSPQVIHKAVLTQFTALDGKTDRSSNPNRLGLESPQSPAKNFSKPMVPHYGNTEDHPNLSMATWSVPGTTESQLEPNDLDDHERGTPDEVE